MQSNLRAFRSVLRHSTPFWIDSTTQRQICPRIALKVPLIVIPHKYPSHSVVLPLYQTRKVEYLGY
jgi:hypothetical protein